MRGTRTRGLGCYQFSRIMLLWIPSNWNKLLKKIITLTEYYHKSLFLQQIKIFLNEIIGCTIISICFNYKMNAVLAESCRLWYFAITAVHAERWWKVSNCSNRLQWVDCICFGPAVRNGIGYGTVPYPRSDFSKFVGSRSSPPNDLDTNIVSKMSKCADDTTLFHRAGNPDDITELQEDINKLVELPNKWQINFNVDKCSETHIGHNNMQGNYNLSKQQLPTTDQQWDLGTIIIEDLKWQKQSKIDIRPTEYTRVHCKQFQLRKQRTDPPMIQILSPPTSHLEHAVQFWCAHLKRGIDKI